MTAICKMLGHFEIFVKWGVFGNKHPFLVKQVESLLTVGVGLVSACLYQPINVMLG